MEVSSTGEMAKFDSLVCHLCNMAGTESCDESYAVCLCKPWYEGEYCQSCRFARDYVLAPNGSCIPCNCGLRSIYECFQNNLCMKYAGESVRDAVAVSALFLSAIATITCVSICIVWRIITRSKRLTPVILDIETDPEIGFRGGSSSSRVELASALSAEMDIDEDDASSTANDRRFLLTPVSRTMDDSYSSTISSAVTLAVYGRTAAAPAVVAPPLVFTNCLDPINRRASISEGDRQPPDVKMDSKPPKPKDCTKYVFVNVRREDACEDEQEEDDERVT